MRIFTALFLSFLLGSTVVEAEFICSSEVNYKWKKAQEEKDRESYWGNTQAEGSDEKAAKENLTQLLARDKSRALQDCQKEHENHSGCLSTKYKSLAGMLQTMRPEPRKAVEDAIVADCANAQGTCLEAKSTDPVCVEKVVTAAAGATPTPAAKEDKKKK